MPRLRKGAKWTYGWVIVGSGAEMRIPPDAWLEYGFRAGDTAIFRPGSSKSGGFAIGTAALAVEAENGIGGASMHESGRSRFDEGLVSIPPALSVRPDDRLLTVRGSCHGLGFVARGPIYDEASRHPELEVFDPPASTVEREDTGREVGQAH